MITKHTTTFVMYTLTVELEDTRNGYQYGVWLKRDDGEHFFIDEKVFKRKPTRAQIERLAKEMAYRLDAAIGGLAACISKSEHVKVEEENGSS